MEIPSLIHIKFEINALSGKMLLVRIIEIKKKYAYFRLGWVKCRLPLPRSIMKGIRTRPTGLEPSVYRG